MQYSFKQNSQRLFSINLQATFIMYIKIKTPGITKIILKKKNIKDILPDFNTYYKVIVIKTVCYQHKHRQINEW